MHCHPRGLGRCHAEQLVRKGLQDVGGACEFRKFDQHHQSTGALHQVPYCADVGFSLDRIAFPVPRQLIIFDFG